MWETPAPACIRLPATVTMAYVMTNSGGALHPNGRPAPRMQAGMR